jgi:photosystem II stability/assembly factor-like uncharacterized protein
VFRDVEAFNPNHAVVLASETGIDSSGQLKPSRISATPNGGNNWQTVFDANQGDYYDSLAFFDHRRGLAVSDPPIPNGDKFPILATDDGGDNWSLVQPTGMPDAEVGEFGRATGTCLVAVGPRDAWFGTAFNKDLAPNAKARVFRTQDGGQSWKVVTTPIPGQPTGIVSLSFRDPMNGLAVGENPPPPIGQTDVGVAARTSDGGATWVPVGPQNGFRNSVAWIPGLTNTAVAVGHTGSDVTDDGGDSWTQFDSRLLLGVAARRECMLGCRPRRHRSQTNNLKPAEGNQRFTDSFGATVLVIATHRCPR